MTTKRKFKSDAFEAIHASASALHRVGAIDNAIMKAITPPTILVGQIKSFGQFGPKYEVGKAIHQSDDGEWMIEITMIETGEKAEYPVTSMQDDPEAL